MRFLTELRQRIGTERVARTGRQKDGRRPNRPAPRCRPRLEALEDRCVPSTLTVTNPGDDVNVKGTLRYDIAHAASGDTILITGALHGALIVLTHGELYLNKDLTIKAAPNHTETISGNNNSRVFEVASGAHVTLMNLTITDGNPEGSYTSGGGILNNGTLTVSSCTLSDNTAGGSIGLGGGVYNGGTLTLNNSTLTDNSAGNDGGGIFNDRGTVSVGDSSFSGNTPDAISGGYTDEGGNTFS